MTSASHDRTGCRRRLALSAALLLSFAAGCNALKFLEPRDRADEKAIENQLDSIGNPHVRIPTYLGLLSATQRGVKRAHIAPVCSSWFQWEWYALYMFVCRPVINGENLYAGVCWSKDKEGKRNANTGFVTILDKDNKVISSPGGETPQYQNGILLPTLQMANPVFQHGHDVCIDEDKSIYVCQWNANQTPPVKLTRV